MSMAKLKVLQVLGSLNMGGAESRMMDVFRQIDREATEFHFLVLNTEENQYFEAEIRSLGGTIIKTDAPKAKDAIRHVQTLRKILFEGKYDAVHAHTSYHCGLVMYAAKKEGVPVRISHARTNGSKRKSLFKQAYIAFGKWLIGRCATNKLAISKAAGQFLFGNKKFDVVQNTIALDTYLGHRAEREIIRQDLGVDADSFVIGQIGRFDPMKNHEFTIEWFNGYLKQNQNARLVFVGDGALRSDIEQRVQEYGLEGKVLFLGVRSDVARLLSAFDVLFFPSKFEGLGGVVLEAQAAGIPVVQSTQIPRETDLGLGLITRVSLQSSLEEWASAVDGAKGALRPSEDEIIKAFEEHGFIIQAVTKRYLEIYNGKMV